MHHAASPRRAPNGGFRPLQSFVIPTKAVIPITGVIPAKAVILAQAGIHVGAGCRWWCRDFGLPTSRQSLTGKGPGCDGASLHAGPAWRSSLVAAKARAPRPQRFVGALGQWPSRSPGTNSPLDCLCPGLAFSAHQRRVAAWAHAPLRASLWCSGGRGPEDRTPQAQRRARRCPAGANSGAPRSAAQGSARAARFVIILIAVVRAHRAQRTQRVPRCDPWASTAGQSTRSAETAAV